MIPIVVRLKYYGFNDDVDLQHILCPLSCSYSYSIRRYALLFTIRSYLQLCCASLSKRMVSYQLHMLNHLSGDS